MSPDSLDGMKITDERDTENLVELFCHIFTVRIEESDRYSESRRLKVQRSFLYL